jgi:hypothetical protein
MLLQVELWMPNISSGLGWICCPPIPMVELGLHRSIWQILDGGVEGRFPTVLKSSVPALLCTPRAALWHEGVLLSRLQTRQICTIMQYSTGIYVGISTEKIVIRQS